MNTEAMPLKHEHYLQQQGGANPLVEEEAVPFPATTAKTKTRVTRAALVLCVLVAIVVGVTSWSGSRKKRCYMCNNVCYPYPCKLPPPHIIHADYPSDAAAVGVLRDGASTTTETGTGGAGDSSYYIPQRKRAKAGTGGAGYYSRYYSHSKSDKKKSSKKDDKKQKKYRKAALRIVETIDPVDPNGSGDITLSLGFNPLTQGLTLVGSNFVTNGAVFKPNDIKVVDGKLIGTIPFEKQLGESSSTCVISKGDFDPDKGIIFIASATCNYSTCFSSGQFNDRVEQCFFGISGGTLNINAAQLIFGEPINGILLGGTFGFEGLSGKFVVNKIVQGEFPPPSPPVIQYNVFQIDFEFTTDDDEFDFGPYPNPFE